MTIQEEYELSCYEELTRIKENKNVFLVRHMETGRICIKKKIDIYNESVYLKLKDMKPEGMPRIHFCAEQEGKLIVIEDYIQGRSLQEIYDAEGPFSEEQVVRLVWNLCDILQRLHKCEPPIIHRDIKPSNIMLSDDDVVKLIDFNAAKEFAEGKTEDTLFIGTRDFAAPEQYGFGQSDVRTDIYAIGVSMNYLLTGAIPRWTMYQGPLREVIGKCVKLDAADRYQSISELKEAISGKAPDEMLEKQGKAEVGEKRQDKEKQQNGEKRQDKEKQQDGEKRQDKEKQQDGEKRQDKKKRQDKEKQRTAGLYARKAFLPVGFRTGRIWKMLTAVFGYWLLIRSCLSMSVTDSNGQEMTGVSLWVNRWGALILFLGYLFYIGNYRNIRSRAASMVKNPVSKWLLHLLYLFLYSFLVVVIIMLLE